MGDVVPLVPDPSSNGAAAGADPAGLAVRAAQAAIGAVAMTLGTLAEVIRQAAGLLDEDRDDTKEGAALVAGAALGFATEALRTTAALIDAGVRVARPVVVASGAALAPLRRVSEELLRRWDETWEAERPDAEALAGAVAAETTRRAVDAVLDQLDLTEVVLDRVELDRIVATLDVDEIARRIDVDAIVAEVDLDGVVSRVDLDAVASRINVDAVAERIDVVRIVDRLDLSSLALDVIDRIDLPEIIRASTSSVASETVRGVRMDAVSADQAVTRIVDRLLRRRRGEGTEDVP